MAYLSLALLGSFQATLAGLTAEGFKSNKVRALLAFLAVEADRPHQRESLVGLLWPDLPESMARGNLRHALANLRQVIADHRAAPAFLHITPETIQFNRASDAWLDVADFTALLADRPGNPHRLGPESIEPLTRAVELYRGKFLEGFSLKDSPAFDDWVLLTRERLQRQAMAALEQLAGCYDQQQEYELACRYAWRQVELEPWQEEAHQQLMRLLALSGRRSAALAQYDTCRHLLTQELGVEPGPETIALYEQIRTGKLGRRGGEPRREAAPPTSPALPPFLTQAAPPASPRTPFVAREKELACLHEFLGQALAGQGLVVWVTGGTGQGKTALLQAFARQAQEAQPGLLVALGRSNAYTGAGDPYLPFREIAAMLTGDIEASWAAGAISAAHATRLWQALPQAVQALLEHGPNLLETFIPGTALIGRVGAHPTAQAQLPQVEQLIALQAAQPASVVQHNLFEQYTHVLKNLARQPALLLLLDDLQWADNGSISLLFHLGRRLPGSRILLVGAYRPDDIEMGRDGEQHPLAAVINEFKRDFGEIEVPLGQAEDRHFVEAFLDTEPNRLNSAFRETLFRQTKGHPLFTVELLRGMRQRGDLIQDEAGYWIEGPALNWNALPARVEAVIAERINRLPAEWRATLAAASVEGEEFTAEVLAQVQGIDRRELIRGLSSELSRHHRLISAQSFQRLESQSLSRYRFRHYLFQKYLYQSLDQVEQAYLHESTGHALETLYGQHAAVVSGQLARHFQAAGLMMKAAGYLLQAGQGALLLAANEEAINHFRQGLTILNTLPDTAERARQELALQTALGAPLLATQGFAAPAVEQVFTRAQELCRQLGEPPELFPVLWGLWSFYLVRAQHRTATQLAQQLLQIAQHSQDIALDLAAQWAMGCTYVHTGKPTSAHAYLDRAVATYVAEQHHSLTFLYGTDPGVASRAWGTWALDWLGYRDQAVRLGQEALTLGRQLDHPFTIAFFGFVVMAVYQFRREALTVQQQAEIVIKLSTEHNFPFPLAMGLIWRGWALAQQGQGDEGITQLQQGLAIWQATGAGVGKPHFLALLAEAYAQVDQIEAGLEVLAKALTAAYASGELYYAAEVHRLKGILLLAQAPENQAEAEQCFRQAISMAQAEQAKLWELRAALSLGRLLHKMGRTEEAYRLMAEIYNWFEEGLDTLDLQEARTFLTELKAAKSRLAPA
jgi:DNA-binding SARP family transcriptional activator